MARQQPAQLLTELLQQPDGWLRFWKTTSKLMVLFVSRQHFDHTLVE
jgi:hypothetical protein